jgi:HAD superfamily hydrolase (TIGR01458 family)
MVIGGGCDDFTYVTLNRVFRRLMDGAPLIGMHRNLYWRTSEGLDLDGGAYIAGLEEAAGVTATICGKPAPAFFDSALSMLGVGRDRAAMVGDDIVNDVLGAQAAGITGVLVRTGKFMPSDQQKGEPDHAIDSIGDLPGLLEG